MEIGRGRFRLKSSHVNASRASCLDDPRCNACGCSGCRTSHCDAGNRAAPHGAVERCASPSAAAPRRRAAPPRPRRSGCPSSSLSIKPGSSASGARLPLLARTSTRIAGWPARPCTGSTAMPPKRRSERGQHLGEPVGAPDQGQRAGGMQQPVRGRDPVRRARARRAACAVRRCRIGRDVLPRRIVERRIHQHVIGTSRAEAARRQTASAGAVDVERDRAHADRRAVARDVLGRRARQAPDRSRPASPSTSGNAHRERQARRRRRRRRDRPHGRRGARAVAAASRMASWPTRWPRRFCISRSRPPSTASSVVSRSSAPRPERGRSSWASPASSRSWRAAS